MTRLLSITLFLLTFGLALPAVADTEYLVVSGGPAVRQFEDLRKPGEQHDRWWGNFIRTARVRMQEIHNTAPAGTRITWLVYRDGYVRRSAAEHQPLTQNVESVPKAYPYINLVWFRSADELIHYINHGAAGRGGLKISGFEYFGHSNKYSFMFDYSSDTYATSTAWLHQNDLHKLSRWAFSSKAYCQSWGCHTAESFSKAWKRATGTFMVGALGKTDYSDMHLRDWHVGLSSGSRWVKR
ncbi:hypothetical protein [Prosthecobacter vanneervenii]|uniref:Uncharacterized protein n=1 Tax=Prosthecobacter vanneervenii TaxID=48466 RepID=A0A7W7YF06_9BACT|nr:hypothetical protein [Prosthecobacter vanneervenii]MBB5034958.1 hypothetical protein [Prosthecobacter vanneervenii]